MAIQTSIYDDPVFPVPVLTATRNAGGSITSLWKAVRNPGRYRLISPPAGIDFFYSF